MSAPSLASQAALAGDYPSQSFNKREQKLLESVKTYVDSLSPETLITTQGDLIIGGSAGVAERLAKGSSGLPLVAGASTSSYAQLAAAGIASSAVTLAKLHSGVAPSHVIKFGAQFTTVGGAAAEAITVTGAASTDLAFVRLVNDGTNNVTLDSWAVTADTLTVTFSGDPGNDAVIDYILIKAAS